MRPTITELPMPDQRVRCFRSDPEVDCYAVLTQKYAVIVDTFGTPSEMMQALDLLGDALAGRQLLVVNTHDHYDHAWGNSVFAASGPYPAPIIGHAGALALEHLEASEAALEAKQAEDERFREVKLKTPDLTFTQEFAIHGGDLTLHLLPAPGHTDDQVVVWIPELRFLLAADALEYPFPLLEGEGLLPALRTTIERLRELQPDVVLPCHGGRHGAELADWNLAYLARLQAPFAYPFEEMLADLGVATVPNEAFYREMHALNAQLARTSRRA